MCLWIGHKYFSNNVVAHVGDTEGYYDHNNKDHGRINQQAFKPCLQIVYARIIIGQHGQHCGQVIAFHPNLNHLHVEFRQFPLLQGFLQRDTLG